VLAELRPKELITLDRIAYDQARTQGNRKKKREYKERIAELNRLRKAAERERNRSKR
jgi:hypothetical protein